MLLYLNICNISDEEGGGGSGSLHCLVEGGRREGGLIYKASLMMFCQSSVLKKEKQQ